MRRLSWFLLFTLLFYAFDAEAQVLKRRQAPRRPSVPLIPSEQAPADLDAGTENQSDRWEIKPPPYELNKEGRLWNPYRQNILKGDYPIIGQNTFMILTGTSETLVEGRKLPVPSNISAAGPGRFNFFGQGDQLVVQQNFRFTFEMYHGNTAFKPRDWEIRLTPVLNLNYLKASERGVVNIDVTKGSDRFQADFALQEALAEFHLANISKYHDFISIRGGIQPFTSDFRGFIFSDTNLAGRLFGSFANNRFQWNLVFFEMLEKSTNSELNTFARRDQEILIGNLFWQDFLGILGWTNQFSLHWNHDQPSTHFDINGVLTRPDPAGAATPHEIDAVYLGWTSDGHIGRFNFSHAFYLVLGEDDLNQIAGRRTSITAGMTAAELSYDRDWYRLRGSMVFATGDSNPTNGRATGFDTIFDFPKFAGGENSFFHRQAIRLNGVNLTQRNSFFPNLRSSKIEGQANFVNPGLLLFNVGSDIEILPTLRTVLNVNYLRFVETAPLELFLNQGNIRHDIGLDYSVGIQYRPLLNNNFIVNFSGAVFQPFGGFKDILTSNVLYSVFLNTVLAF
jgi:hypothetical protein